MSLKTKWLYKMAVWTVIASQIAVGLLSPVHVYATGDATEFTQLMDLAEAYAADAANVASTNAGKVATVAAIVTALGAGASLLSKGNMNDVMDDVEQRYHIDKTSVQNFGETMNTSAGKETMPQMNLFFNPTDPKSGKEITAQAFPLYFSNQKENLYFTWYLKRDGCNSVNEAAAHQGEDKDKYKTPDNGSDLEKSCDTDGDHIVTENDWKVAAMRRIVNGGFAGDQVDYTSNGDDDGYKAQFGGDKSTSNYCYLHDFDSGADYELAADSGVAYQYRHTLNSDGTVAASSYVNSDPTAYTYVTTYIHTLDPDTKLTASPPYESTSSAQIEPAAPTGVYRHINNSDGTLASAPYINSVSTPYTGYQHTNNSDGTVATTVYRNTASTPYHGYNHTHDASGADVVDYINTSSVPVHASDTVTLVNTDTVTVKDDVVVALDAGSTPTDTVTKKYYSSTPIDTVTKEMASNSDSCRHFFPKSDTSTPTGDGSFGKDEEKFWHTDPQDPSTAQNGNKDEANAVGLGQDKFTWNYASKDQVGVVIEGVSMMPTKHADASNKVMFAFSKNKCGIGSSAIGSVAGASYNGGVASIPTVNMDDNALNKCLKDNLVDPTQGDQAGKLEVQLTASPENPVIDSFSKEKPDKRGDIVTVQSSLVNSATKDSNISYDWSVYANSNQSQTDDSAWENITQGLVDAHAISDVLGSDLSALKINLNIDEETKVNGKSFFETYFKENLGYFRVNVTATENFDIGKKRVGRSSAVVKIVRSQAQVQTHAVTVDTTNWKLKFVTPAGSDTGMLCEESVSDRAVCPVVKGQVIGLSIDTKVLGFKGDDSSPDISWVINNKSFRCSVAVSEADGCIKGEKNFFPVTGEAGEIYTVTMTANSTHSGKSVTLNRIFRVVEPALLITSADGGKAWPKYLGQYVDANGNTTDNYSQETFESFSGGTFALKGLFYPNSLKSGANVAWSVNGVSVVPDDKGLVTVNAAQDPGSIYTISLSGVYTPSPQIKKALTSIWGISVADVTETVLSRTIQVETVQSVDGLAVGPLNSSKKFFASLISYVPASVIFSFRLAMTMGLILLVLGITFSFIPEQRRT